MSRKRHPLKTITKISTRFSRRFLVNAKKQIIWLLRTIFGTQKRQISANAGFVLPTIAMVSIVVILLTTAIMLRSFDRAKNASNVRMNEAVLSAATPAIDRGRAKINKLFQDTSLPRATPTDSALYTLLVNKLDSFTLGDETQLQIGFDIDGNGKIDPPTSATAATATTPATTDTALYDNETVKTAWRFPVDTDNNGKFDSYTLYAILFRTPQVSSGGQYARARNPLEARTPPMATGTLNANCGATTSASLVGNTGWVLQNNALKKSFFVYTATVPITTPPDTTNYEKYKGGSGFAAVEYQQDRIQIPPNNTAVVYDDDIALNPGGAFVLNGAIFTNSNFLTSGVNSGSVRFYQVSSTSSCYYDPKNAKIIVGGNTAIGGFTEDITLATNPPTVDLYNGKIIPDTNNPAVNTGAWVNSTSSSIPSQIAYNNLAYVNRINKLVAAQMANNSSTDPTTVTTGYNTTLRNLGLTNPTQAEIDKYRRQQLTLYFKNVTRRVPYTEVSFANTNSDSTPDPLLQTDNNDPNTLRPNDLWIYPTKPTDGITVTKYTNLPLNTNGTSLEPQATEPQTLRTNSGVEGLVGDRVLVGNNLPALWWDTTKNAFVGSGVNDTQSITGINWNLPTGTTINRTRNSLVQTLADVGSTDRDGYWELAAAQVPSDPTEAVGGLRVITGAGIYLTGTEIPTTLPSTTTIWPDSNPVPQVPTEPDSKPYSMYADLITDPKKDPSSITYRQRSVLKDAPSDTPYLQMRATAVYHYKSTNYSATTPKPIACVSSFYVPSKSDTAKNQDIFAGKTLPPTLENGLSIKPSSSGRSNNGIVYPAPTKTVSDYKDVLDYQSKLTYPNGRSIDDGLLLRALEKKAADEKLTISEQSAIDAQICALQIRYDKDFLPLDTASNPTSATPIIEHGAIREIAFLASREVLQNSNSVDNKGVLKNLPSQTYDLPIKDRQPLEIRATVLDLDLLRKKPIAGASPAEYLLPNSGIIYVARDGALPDMSADITTTTLPPLPPLSASDRIPSEANKSVSPVDYKLDPTRRPDGVMLINGSKLSRQITYRSEEKGLILATSLPVYVKGDFNLHSNDNNVSKTNPKGLQEEFTDALDSTWSNFYSRSTLNNNFACRSGDPRLPNCNTGDEWRPATVLADAVTLLSSGFREGFRDEGEYDWNNSIEYDSNNSIRSSSISSLSEFNFFGANGTWADSTGYPRDFVPDVTGQAATIGYQASSYVNNFATPLVMRIKASDYCTNLGLTLANSYCSKPDLIPWLSPSFTSGSLTELKPVLQIQQPFATATNRNDVNSLLSKNDNKNWIQEADATTTFNLIIAAGDSPARYNPGSSEDNGSLNNFVRLMESWNRNKSALTLKISGAFMQVKKSAYATGPYAATFSTDPYDLNLNYKIGTNTGKTTGFIAPARQWGYDVALLSQSPDLFASKLVLTPPNLPDEYFREVSRDDNWVQTLLCAKNASPTTTTTGTTTTTATTPVTNSTDFAIDANQRPSCKPYSS